MKKTAIIFVISLILTAVLFSCGGGGGGADNAIKEVFTISYNANGAEYGVAPAKQSGDEDSPQEVQANTGNLSKSGYLFDGWNTAADGSGTNYAPGSSYKGKNVTLYAKWAAIFNVQVINPGSSAPALNGAQQRAPGVPYIKILSLTAKGKTLVSIIIPESIDGYHVVSIGAGAFQGCDSVTELIIPNTVTSIENNAFSGCIGLSTMTIPNSVTSIGDGAFSDCAGLNSLIMLTATPPAMGTGAFEGCTATVSVPAAGVDDYKAAEGWNTYSASIAGYSNETHTVTFDSQGATTGANPASIAVEPPNVTVGQLPVAPKRTGYLFGGWFKEPGGAGGEFTASTVVSSNMTVYAKWESYEYTVTFDDQGATTPASPTSKTVASPNTTVDSLPSEPENTGYYFGGWNTKADGTGTPFTAETIVTDNIAVYAVWLNNPTRTVTFDGQEATTQANPTTKQVVSPAVTIDSLPTAPKKTGYNFGGWFRNQDGTGGEFTASSVVAEDITVYAKWNEYEYTVTFDSQGADTDANPTSKTVSSPDTRLGTLPSNPVKTGYTFGGWFSEPNGQGTQIKTSTVVNSNLRAYAKWTANSYQITYRDEGNNTFSGIHENNYPTRHAYGIDTVLDSPTRPGYLFEGWYTDSNCSSSPVTQLDATAYTQAIRLYAKWTCYLTYVNDGNNFSITITGLTAAGENLSSIVIPSEINGKTVSSIGLDAFSNCTKITNVTIPDTVNGIAMQAFAGCTNLISISLPSNLTVINDHTFLNCSSLTDITLPSNLTSIGRESFGGCRSLTSIIIPNKVTSIGMGAFDLCTNLNSITIPSSVTTIEDYAFRRCPLNSISFNGNNAFICEDGVLLNKNKTKIIYYPTGKSANIYSIPNTVTGLPVWTFDGCKNLISITIPSSVEYIGQMAFNDCTSLSIVRMESSIPPELYNENFNYPNHIISKIIVPAEAVETYKAANGWKNFAALIVADE